VDIKDDPSKPFDENKETGSILKVGEGILSPGDDESLIGKEIGESVEITTKFPEDYYEESLRNKETTIYVLIKGIKTLELPPIDEEFAKRFNYQSVEAMREGFKEGIYKERLVQKEEEMYHLIKERLAESVKEDIPDIMVRNRLEYWKRILYNNREAPEDFEEKNYQYALNDIKAALALRYIADKESLEPTEEEINRVLNSWKIRNITDEVRNNAISVIKEDKALKFLLDLIKNKEGEG
jgi:trigger factor